MVSLVLILHSCLMEERLATRFRRVWLASGLVCGLELQSTTVRDIQAPTSWSCGKSGAIVWLPCILSVHLQMMERLGWYLNAS